MSIGKSQAEALADGFLNSLGTTKADLRPRETFSEIIILAGEFIEDAQKNLNRANSNASGKLSASLIASEPVLSGTKLKIDINMNSYGQYVNRGVKGTKSGSGQFQFKYDKPSRKMVTAITEWMKRGKLSSTNVTKRTTSRNEQKNSAISDLSKAYAVARAVVQHGIKATGFLDKAIITTQVKVKDRLGAALKIDIINSITA